MEKVFVSCGDFGWVIEEQVVLLVVIQGMSIFLDIGVKVVNIITLYRVFQKLNSKIFSNFGKFFSVVKLGYYGIVVFYN